MRRFVPKGTDIGKLTKKELQRIEDWVNHYPRKMFGYKSANQIAAAKARGVQLGRPVATMPVHFAIVVSLWEGGEISFAKTMAKM